jgi:hypothetical protein
LEQFWNSRHSPNVTRAPDGARQLTTLNGQVEVQVGIEAYSATIVSSPETEFERRAIEDWGKLLGNSAVVTAMLDRLLHHCIPLNAGREAGGPICRRNNEHRTKNSRKATT